MSARRLEASALPCEGLAVGLALVITRPGLAGEQPVPAGGRRPVEEQVMERRAGQHDAQPRRVRARCRAAGRQAGLLVQQARWGARGSSTGGRRGADAHQAGRTGGGRPSAPGAGGGAACGRRRATTSQRWSRIAGQVENRRALDGDDLAQADAAQRLQRSHRASSDAVGLVQSSGGAACRPGQALSSAWKRRSPGWRYSAAQARALLEAGHAGARPVVRQAAGDGVARPAVGAVDEGVAPAPVVGVEQLGEARRADADVRDRMAVATARRRWAGSRITAPVVGRDHLRPMASMRARAAPVPADRG